MPLPKGASDKVVQAGKDIIVAKFGKEILQGVARIPLQDKRDHSRFVFISFPRFFRSISPPSTAKRQGTSSANTGAWEGQNFATTAKRMDTHLTYSDAAASGVYTQSFYHNTNYLTLDLGYSYLGLPLAQKSPLYQADLQLRPRLCVLGRAPSR